MTALPAQAGTLTCALRTTACNAGEVEIFETEKSVSNTHVGLPAANYANLVCCSGVTGLSNACSGTFATVLKLSGTTNAHVRQGTLADYPSATNACISVPSGGTVSVAYRALNCNTYDMYLGKMKGTTNSHLGTVLWAAGDTFICASAAGPGVLSVDIVDAVGTPVTSPAVPFGATTLAFTYQTANGTLGTTSEKILVINTTSNPLWTLSIAPTSGPSALWDAGVIKYDFNDPTANAVDGGDADVVGGKLTVDPSTATNSGTCTATGLTAGSATAFSEGVTNSVTLASTGGTADTNCYWGFGDFGVAQTIPAEQAATSYSIPLTLTIVAN